MSSRIVSATTVVPAPADVIFAILADPQQHTRIDGSGSVRGVVSGPDRLSLDATFAMNMNQGAPYKITSRVTEFEEGRRLAWRHPLGHVWRYVLKPVDSGTQVTESFDYSGVGSIKAAFLGLGGFPKRNQKGMEQTLVRLAEVAKVDAAGGTGT